MPLSALIMRYTSRPRWQGAILTAAIAGNLAALFWCKYLAAMLWFLRVHGVADIALADPVLPLGISFFTFTQIGFLVDCRQGLAREPLAAQLRTVRQLLSASDRRADPASPRNHAAIRRPDDLAAASAENLAVGSAIFLIGLLKKSLLADPLAPIASAGFANPAALTLFSAWHAALAYSLQLYFDFSGYSDMAIGLARLFNLRFPLNFHSPYQAQSVIDYWQRWHMTLTRWLMLYLYNPLALRISRRRAARGLPIDRTRTHHLARFRDDGGIADHGDDRPGRRVARQRDSPSSCSGCCTACICASTMPGGCGGRATLAPRGMRWWRGSL